VLFLEDERGLMIGDVFRDIDLSGVFGVIGISISSILFKLSKDGTATFGDRGLNRGDGGEKESSERGDKLLEFSICVPVASRIDVLGVSLPFIDIGVVSLIDVGYEGDTGDRVPLLLSLREWEELLEVIIYFSSKLF